MPRDYGRLASRHRSKHEGSAVLTTIFQLDFYLRLGLNPAPEMAFKGRYRCGDRE